MSKPVILELYEELNATGNLARYAQEVQKRYFESTLQRLLAQRDTSTREAALAALRVIGTMSSNAILAACLRDADLHVRELAESAMWAIWFRADSAENNQELQRLMHLVGEQEFAKALAGLDALIRKASKFAEAFNQRAILYYRWGQYRRSITDCERTIKLNPYHFGAMSGMAQCFLQLKKPVEALRAFRHAQRINPSLDGIQESIRALEQYLREERRKRGGK